MQEMLEIIPDRKRLPDEFGDMLLDMYWGQKLTEEELKSIHGVVRKLPGCDRTCAKVIKKIADSELSNELKILAIDTLHKSALKHDAAKEKAEQARKEKQEEKDRKKGSPKRKRGAPGNEDQAGGDQAGGDQAGGDQAAKRKKAANGVAYEALKRQQRRQQRRQL